MFCPFPLSCIPLLSSLQPVLLSFLFCPPSILPSFPSDSFLSSYSLLFSSPSSPPLSCRGGRGREEEKRRRRKGGGGGRRGGRERGGKKENGEREDRRRGKEGGGGIFTQGDQNEFSSCFSLLRPFLFTHPSVYLTGGTRRERRRTYLVVLPPVKVYGSSVSFMAGLRAKEQLVVQPSFVHR